jgi:hypothetical protein
MSGGPRKPLRNRDILEAPRWVPLYTWVPRNIEKSQHSDQGRSQRGPGICSVAWSEGLSLSLIRGLVFQQDDISRPDGSDILGVGRGRGAGLLQGTSQGQVHTSLRGAVFT